MNPSSILLSFACRFICPVGLLSRVEPLHPSDIAMSSHEAHSIANGQTDSRIEVPNIGSSFYVRSMILTSMSSRALTGRGSICTYWTGRDSRSYLSAFSFGWVRLSAVGYARVYFTSSWTLPKITVCHNNTVFRRVSRPGCNLSCFLVDCDHLSSARRAMDQAQFRCSTFEQCAPI